MAGPARADPSTRTRRVSSTSTKGLDFLGFNIRRYSSKLLIKPSKLRAVRSLRGSNAAAVLRTINPVVRGWAAYYRGSSS
jgi:hypothetical protein